MRPTACCCVPTAIRGSIPCPAACEGADASARLSEYRSLTVAARIEVAMRRSEPRPLGSGALVGWKGGQMRIGRVLTLAAFLAAAGACQSLTCDLANRSEERRVGKE